MGYMHITNLYKDQKILLFRECFALEKVHGTSAHIAWKDGVVRFFSGGEAYERFAGLFNVPTLSSAFIALGHADVVVYGEAYGGKQQGMSGTYGPNLRFIAFEVTIGGKFLAVPQAEQVAVALGLEFVPYEKGPTDLEWLNAQRDRDSIVAERCGITGKKREGVVLRPLVEVTLNNGERVIAKHKRDDFSERATPQKVANPEALAVLSEAQAIADEWVTDMRLAHVLQRIPAPWGMEHTPAVIRAMVEDVEREAAGEIVASKEARAAIGKRAAALFHARVKAAPPPP